MSFSIKDYTEYILKLTNDELYDEYEEAQQPDDYDGCMTNEGQHKQKATKAEFEKRLKEIGFLTK